VITIARREIDARPIIGAVVVFAIIGAAIFGVYYFRMPVLGLLAVVTLRLG